MKIGELNLYHVIGDMLHLSQRQNSIILPVNTDGKWNGILDNLLYQNFEVGQNLGSHGKPHFAEGPTSVYHQQVARFVQAHQLPAGLEGTVFPAYSEEQPQSLSFNHVAFVFENYNLPLSELVENALREINRFPLLCPNVAMPLMRTGRAFSIAPEMSYEEVISELAVGVARFGRLSASRPNFELTIVAHPDSRDLSVDLARALRKLGAVGL